MADLAKPTLAGSLTDFGPVVGMTDVGQTNFGNLLFSVLAKFSQPTKPKLLKPEDLHHKDLNNKPGEPPSGPHPSGPLFFWVWGPTLPGTGSGPFLGSRGGERGRGWEERGQLIH